MTFNQKPASLTSDASEMRLFSSSFEQVEIHMALATMFCMEQLPKLTVEQQQRYLAFELGVLEYYDRVMLQEGLSEKDSGVRFINFLIYYANRKNAELAETVFQFWWSLFRNGGRLTERKLGFDSANDRVNVDGSRKVGHSPVQYLTDAIGFDIK